MRILIGMLIVALIGAYIVGMKDARVEKATGKKSTSTMIESVFDQSDAQARKMEEMNQKTQALIEMNENRQTDRLNSY